MRKIDDSDLRQLTLLYKGAEKPAPTFLLFDRCNNNTPKLSSAQLDFVAASVESVGR